MDFEAVEVLNQARLMLKKALPEDVITVYQAPISHVSSGRGRPKLLISEEQLLFLKGVFHLILNIIHFDAILYPFL